MDFVLGVDVGTSSCKATLIDQTGASFTASSGSYGLIAPQKDWAEQDPATWRSAATQSIWRVRDAAGVSPAQIRAVGVTGQMHTAVMLDAAQEVIRPPLLWCDQRPTLEAAEANGSFRRFQDVTLNPLLPAFTLSKLLWSREHEPEAYARVRHVVLPKDLLRLWLTGSLATDPSDAAGTGMFDSHSWHWSAEILDHFGIPSTWLPAVLPSAAVAGVVGGVAATTFGLQEGTPVVAGAGDQASQALGLRAIDPRVLALQIGTSGVVVLATSLPVPGSFCHALEGRWMRLDSLHSAGSSLLWVRDALAEGEAIEHLLQEAADIPPGAEGMLYLPFLMGERAGFAASVPAAFVGLQPHHRRATFVRAVLEGVSFELRRMFDRWELDGDGPSEIRVVGGGARDVVQLQMLADAFTLPVVRLERDSSYGAAVLAGMGIGWWSGAPEEAAVARIEPDPARAGDWAAAYARYRRLYAALTAYSQAAESEG